jgi:hypothetical protein
LLGRGDDRFEWNPGDASDTINGQSGVDVVDFFASNASETVDVSGDGGHLRIARNIGSVTLDADNVEGLIVRTFGGTDAVSVGDLRGTGVDFVDVDLRSSLGVGDAQPDTIVVNGTSKRDRVQVGLAGTVVLASGLAAQTRIVGSEAALDTLRIQTLDGNDDVTVAPDVSSLIIPIVDLGAGE